MLARIITTTFENNQVQEHIKEQAFIPDIDNQELHIVNLYPGIQYQTIGSFGGAITEAVGLTLNRVSSALSQNVIESYFGQSGIGYQMIRTHVDSCDFSLGNYSAVEDKNDADFSTFSLRHDEENIIPYIHAAYKAAKRELPVMLSPWSPPAFMKTNGDKNGGGKLKKEYYPVWARYLCRYIQEYKKRGVNVTALSVQNEPNAIQKWDSCTFTADEEREFLEDYLAPALKSEGLEKIEVYVWDHNKERLYDRAKKIINSQTDQLISGLAFHWYSGDHFDALRLVHEEFPLKKLLFTEGCIEYSRFSKDNQLNNAQMYAHDIIGNLNAGMNSFIDWNIVLDENGGPNHAGNYCEAPIICDTQNGTIDKKLSFYYIAHFSKYILPGAKRIATTQYTPHLEATAFQNPDGSFTAVLLNQTFEDLPVTFRLEHHLLDVLLPRESISTYLINI